ncbi:DNA-binding protein [Nocardiopsis gilva YIM 90087]|uniref:DNA-binding protein n=1 Tax=Nocardiopsis gilva YIM 90087 TaxID=1235441 RepID=A0A223S0A8_9ACTN|nr:helix-turn-helix domain-containing protein [Nocardiopsis gilva]ASU81556.1 DNA-binding protein [Nocardiopsis gilva YIM 90087]
MADDLTVYRVDEAAQILKCKPSWLRDQAKARRIPFHKISGEYRFTASDLEQILALTAEPVKKAPQPPARSTGPRRRRTPPAPSTDPTVRPLRARRITA